MVKMNFGCGSIQPPGWKNVDNDPAFKAQYNGLSVFDDNYFDFIVSHCTLQISGYEELPIVLKDLYRVLKPGGVLRISLPDILRGFLNYELNNIHWFPNGEEKIDLRFSHWLTWYGTSKSLLTVGALFEKLHEAGFLEISHSYFGSSSFTSDDIAELDTREHECYFVEARK